MVRLLLNGWWSPAGWRGDRTGETRCARALRVARVEQLAKNGGGLFDELVVSGGCEIDVDQTRRRRHNRRGEFLRESLDASRERVVGVDERRPLVAGLRYG